MKPFFEPSDFDDTLSSYGLARSANEKLSAHIETLPVVYGTSSFTTDNSWWFEPCPESTHKALLWGVTEINPKVCEHNNDAVTAMKDGTYWCANCRKTLRPTWTVVEDGS